MTASITLKPKRDAATLRRHPWIFSGAVQRVTGDPAPGALVAIHNDAGERLAWGHYSPHSQIRARLIAWSADEAETDSADFWRVRLRRAIAARRPLLADGATNAGRLIHAESDGVPGLVVDRYADVVVVQLLTAGAEARRALFTELLWELLAPQTLYERSDVDARALEGLSPRVGLLRGAEPPELVEIREHGLTFLVDVRQGHKTGFYLDQRANRQQTRALAGEFARAADSPPALLNVFSYTGGFAVYGLAGGAGSVVNLDSSAEALALGRENLTRNGFAHAQVEDLEGNAFGLLRQLRAQERRFDIIVLDPPKFAHAQRDVQRASRGYKDINFQALHLLNPGGLLLTFSCSGAISADLFQKIVFGAALDTGREVQIIGALTQGSDHPIALTFPEGAYLKGLLCRALT